MFNNYPHNADGDALRWVAATGADMSQPIVIDFQVAMPSEASAESLGSVARKLGYQVHC
jgi:hypothetical protein